MLIASLHAMFSLVTGFFMLRTYALWNHNKVILAVMLSTFTVSHPQYPGFHIDIVSGSGCGVRSFCLWCHCDCTMYVVLLTAHPAIVLTIFISQLLPARSLALQAVTSPLEVPCCSCLFFCWLY